MKLIAIFTLIFPVQIYSQHSWNMMHFGHGATQPDMGAGNQLWGGHMFGNPHVMPDMMMGMEHVSPAPDVAISTTRKPTRREYLLKQSAKRRIDGPKVKFNPFRNFIGSSPNSLRGSPNEPQKDELEMFVDSVNRMATGFHRLEFRLTKAIKMIDKFVTAV